MELAIAGLGSTKKIYYVEKELVASCYNRVTCRMRFLFQVSSFPEGVISIYKHTILQHTMDMAVVPSEMCRALDRAYLRQCILKACQPPPGCEACRCTFYAREAETDDREPEDVADWA